MALADPYATAKSNLRDNVKVLMTAFAGVAGLLLAGTPFSGFGALLPGPRLAIALVGLVVALVLFSRAMWLLLGTLQPDLVSYEMLRDGFDPKTIRDPQARAEIEDLRKVFDGQRQALLPDGLPRPTVEALEAHITTLWNALPAAPTPADLVDYQQYHDALEGLNHWGAFTRLQRRVRRALRVGFLLGLPALAGILAFTWAVNPPKPDATEARSEVIVHQQLAAAPEAGTEFGPVRFRTDRAELDDAARGLIGQARDHLRLHAGTAVLVRAYTDTQGTDRRNAVLAEERVRAVADALLRPGGVAPNRVFVAALGSSDLPVLTAPQVDQADNRSVWLLVVPLPATR